MICEIGITVLVLLVSGLFGCGNSREYKVDDIALINTTYYGMTREPVYSFALQKEKEDWFFSASLMWKIRKRIMPRSVRSRSHVKRRKDSLRLFVRKER